jgi:hypothetical protein
LQCRSRSTSHGEGDLLPAMSSTLLNQRGATRIAFGGVRTRPRCWYALSPRGGSDFLLRNTQASRQPRPRTFTRGFYSVPLFVCRRNVRRPRSHGYRHAQLVQHQRLGRPTIGRKESCWSRGSGRLCLAEAYIAILGPDIMRIGWKTGQRSMKNTSASARSATLTSMAMKTSASGDSCYSFWSRCLDTHIV